jgi:hypothetical protein
VVGGVGFRGRRIAWAPLEQASYFALAVYHT